MNDRLIKKMLIAVGICVALMASNCNNPRPKGSITASIAGGGQTLIIKGKDFSPVHTVKFRHQNVPYKGIVEPSISALTNSSDTFEVYDTIVCVNRDPSDHTKYSDIIIAAYDQQADPALPSPVTTVGSWPWLCGDPMP